MSLKFQKKKCEISCEQCDVPICNSVQCASSKEDRSHHGGNTRKSNKNHTERFTKHLLNILNIKRLYLSRSSKC